MPVFLRFTYLIVLRLVFRLMPNNVTWSLSFLIVGVAVFFVSRYNANQPPLLVIREMVMNCEFDVPGVYRMGPYPQGIRWCNLSDKTPYIALINHLRVNTPVGGVSFAQEYGSNIRAMYVDGVFMFNPDVVELGSRTIYCEDDIGLEFPVKKVRPSQIKLKYVDQAFKMSEISFVNGYSCVVQSVLEIL